MRHDNPDAGTGVLDDEMPLLGEQAERTRNLVGTEGLISRELLDRRCPSVSGKPTIDGHANVLALLRRGHAAIMPD